MQYAKEPPQEIKEGIEKYERYVRENPHKIFDYADSFINGWVGNEYCKNYLSHGLLAKRNGVDLVVDTPELVLGERFAVMLELVHKYRKQGDAVKLSSAINVAELMLDSVPFLVDHDCMGAAREMVKNNMIPDHQVNLDNIMPFDYCWVTWPTNRISENGDGIGFLLTRLDATTIQVVSFFDYMDVRLGIIDVEQDWWSSLTERVRGLIALFMFMQQRLTRTIIKRPPRGIRKRATGGQGDEVSFVDLRPHDYAHHDSEETGRKYDKWRWLVRGHWRAQWCPSENGHRCIWIDPHIKGPEEAPLKQRVYDVCR